MHQGQVIAGIYIGKTKLTNGQTSRYAPDSQVLSELLISIAKICHFELKVKTCLILFPFYLRSSAFKCHWLLGIVPGKVCTYSLEL